MQVSLGDKAAGFMQWSGSGESWISWRYPFRRRVELLRLVAPSKPMWDLELEINYYDAQTEDFYGCPCVRVESSSPNDAFYVVEVGSSISTSTFG
jgi:hypothetical protein